MPLVYMAVLGLIAGAIAKLIMPGKDPGGILVTMLIGIGGSFVGGFLSLVLGIGKGGTGLPTSGLVGSVIGAIILLALYRWYRKRQGVTT